MGNRRFSLSFKFILIIVTFLALLFIVFSYVLVAINSSTLRNNLVQEARSFTELSAGPIGNAFLDYRDEGRIRISQVIQRFAALNPNITNILIIDTHAAEQFNFTGQPIEPVTTDAANSFEPSYDYNESGNISRAVVPFFEDSGLRRYSVVYEVSDESIRQAVARQVNFTIIFTALGMAFSTGLMYGFIRRSFIKPIKALSEQALAMSLGDIDKQIKITRRDEVADLTRAVNQMALSLKADIKKLEEIDKLKSEFLIIASHNLRTPLTIIQGYLDNAQLATTVEELREILANLKEGSDRLADFAADMITIAELESGQPVGNRKQVKAADFVAQIGAEFAIKLAGSDVEYLEDIKTGDYRIEINESLVRGAIWNLLDNAQKFTKQGSIKLSVQTAGDSVIISVEDTGIGISEQEMDKLFTKFHRGTDVMRYDYEGTGIGLYSSNLVIKEHGGQIKAESTLGKGSRFTIILPGSREERAPATV